MKSLHISDDLNLPLETVAQTLVVYGGKGMGKTNLGSVLAEELYAVKLRFSVIDPMGVWWGLQHGQKRGEPGLEVLILGGLHGDLPIEPTGGEVVADLVADESISVVIDISRKADGKAWSKGEKVRFVTAYLTRLYERQVERRDSLMQIVDEAARYAPQGLRSGDVDEAKCLGAIAMLCEEGRNLGVGMTLLTQRSARLSKDVAELADVMIAFRTVGPNSVGAITDWLGEHVERERHKSIVEQLRSLAVGSALVVSPGWLKFEGVAKMRPRRTFDSSATPKIGQQLNAPGKATKPDLEKYKLRMNETIEKARADDPKELKRQITVRDNRIKELERAKPAKATPPAIDEKQLKASIQAAVRGVEEQWVNIALAARTAVGQLTRECSEWIEKLSAAIKKSGKFQLPKFPVPPGELPLNTAKPPEYSRGLAINRRSHERNEREHHGREIAKPSSNGDGDLPSGERAILTALVQHHLNGGCTKQQLRQMTGYKRSTLDAYLYRLREKQYITDGNGHTIVSSVQGEKALGDFDPLPEGDALLRYWLAKLPEGERKCLECIVAAGGQTIDRSTIDEVTGYKRSTRDAYLVRLTNRLLIEDCGRGMVRASSNLFD
jgi:hypothetical protein